MGDKSAIKARLQELLRSSEVESSLDVSKLCQLLLGSDEDYKKHFQSFCCETDLAANPITHIAVVKNSDNGNSGYIKAVQLSPGLSLCVKREKDWKSPPVISLVVIFPDRKEFVPPGFQTVSHLSASGDPGQLPANLNLGSGERVHLCFKRGCGNPIISLQGGTPPSKGQEESGLNLIMTSPYGHLADLRVGMSATPFLLAYRQKLQSLTSLIFEEPLETGGNQNIWTSLEADSFPCLRLTSPLKGSSACLTPLGSLQGSPDERSCSPGVASPQHGQDLSGSSRETSPAQTSAKTPPPAPPRLPLHPSSSKGMLPPATPGRSISTPSGWVPSSADEANLENRHKISEELQKELMGLYVILRAVYIRHGNLAEAALTQLYSLLCDSNFFAPALGKESQESSEAWYLQRALDVTVAAICDHVDRMQESQFDAVLRCLLVVVTNGQGLLSSVALHKAVKAYRALGAFVALKAGQSGPAVVLRENDLAFVGLKELIQNTCRQFEKQHQLPLPPTPSMKRGKSAVLPRQTEPAVRTPSPTPSFPSLILESIRRGSTPITNNAERAQSVKEAVARGALLSNDENIQLCRSLAEELVVGALHRAELVQATEAMVASLRPSQNRAFDPLADLRFLAEAQAVADTLCSGNRDHASNVTLRNASLLIAFFCRYSAQEISTVGGKKRFLIGPYIDKFLALTSLKQLLEFGGEAFLHNQDLGFLVRRVVTTCLLGNLTTAFQDMTLLQQTVKLVSVLWKKYRRHLKNELAVLCNDFLLRVLRDGYNNPLIRPKGAQDVLQELLTWLDVPHNLVEMFLNFSLDRTHAHHKLVSEMVATICTLAEGPPPVEVSREKTLLYSTQPKEDTESKNKNSEKIALQHLALKVAAQIMKSVMDMSGHGQSLNAGDARMRAISLKQQGGWEEDDPWGEDFFNAGFSLASTGKDQLETSGANAAATKGGKQAARSFKYRQEINRASEELLSKAFEVVQSKSLKKAVQFLVASSFLSDTPRDIANFLRVYRSQLDPAAIGDFLSEGGDGSEKDTLYWNSIRLIYIGAISFHGMHIEDALRHFLTNGGFLLPGEGQKIDRMIETFSQCYCDDNRDTEGWCFENDDAVFLLSYSMIMLQTDLHKANMNKKQKKMTAEDFRRNLRGQNGDQDFPREFLTEIYESIKLKPIQMDLTPDATDSAPEKVSEADYLEQVRTSAKQGEELLQGLARSNFQFLIVGEDTTLSLELVKQIFTDTWYYFHTMIDSILKNINDATLDSVMNCLSTLKNAISSAMFLDMKREKKAFADQMAKFQCFAKFFHENDQEKMEAYFKNKMHQKEKWYQAVETATAYDAWKHIHEVHTVIAELEIKLTECLDMNQLRSIAKKLPKANVLSKDRKYIKQDDLKKFCRSGKVKNYRFILFSDQLMYAHQTYTGELKPHNTLNLKHMRIEDCRKHATNFRINHPTKSFMVSAHSVENKRIWLRALKKAKAAADLESQEHKRRISTTHKAAQALAPPSIQKKGHQRTPSHPWYPGHQRTPSHPLNQIPPAKFTLTRIKDETCLAYIKAKPPVLTSVKQKQIMEQNQVEEMFQSSALDMAELKKRFYAAVEISATVLDDTSDLYSDDQKLQLYGLFKQAKAGDAPQHFGVSTQAESNDVAVSKWEAWAKNRGLGKAQAMIKFINLLGSIAPSKQPNSTNANGI